MMDQDVMLLDRGPARLPWHPTDLYVFKYFTNVTLKSPAQPTLPQSVLTLTSPLSFYFFPYC